MFEIKTAAPRLTYIISSIFLLLSLGKGAIPGSKKEIEPFETSNFTSKERYNYIKEKREGNILYSTLNPSIRWAREAYIASKKAVKYATNINKPTLVFEAENDNKIKPIGISKFINKANYSQCVKIQGSKHEIYLSKKDALITYFTKIKEFLC